MEMENGAADSRQIQGNAGMLMLVDAEDGMVSHAKWQRPQ